MYGSADTLAGLAHEVPLHLRRQHPPAARHLEAAGPRDRRSRRARRSASRDVDVTAGAGAARSGDGLRVPHRPARATSPTRSRFPTSAIALLRGARVLVINALFRTPHPTHLSLPEAIVAAHARSAPSGRTSRISRTTTSTPPRGRAAARHRAGVRRPLHPGLTIPMAIRLDYTNMMSPPIDGGISDAEWREAAAQFDAAHAAVAERVRAAARSASSTCPTIVRCTSRRSTSCSACAPAAARTLTDVVVLGIGGSALGPIALRTALRPPQWNLLDDASARRAARGCTCSTTSIRPTIVGAARAARSRAHAVRRDLEVGRHGGDDGAVSRRPRRGSNGALGEAQATRAARASSPIRRRARCARSRSSEGIAALDIPPNVGGRFSVLTPVGMLPAALIGIDYGRAARRRGATCATRCATNELGENPAGAFAALQWLADTKHGRHIQVLMPYSDRAARHRRLVRAAVGGEPRQASHATATQASARRRSPRSARPTSTARCSCSWRARRTRR